MGWQMAGPVCKGPFQGCRPGLVLGCSSQRSLDFWTGWARTCMYLELVHKRNWPNKLQTDLRSLGRKIAALAIVYIIAMTPPSGPSRKISLLLPLSSSSAGQAIRYIIPLALKCRRHLLGVTRIPQFRHIVPKQLAHLHQRPPGTSANQPVYLDLLDYSTWSLAR